MPPRRIRLSDVGRRNVVYSDAEEIVIKNELKTTEAGLLRLNTLRNNGAARQRQHKDQIHRYQVALAPFKKISKEIWMYIFELCCQSGQLRLSTCDTNQLPVVLMQVCSTWRQITLSMSSLWSDIHLCSNVNLARMWLGRAGNVPRALEAHIPPSDSSDSNMPQAIQSFICSFPFRKLHIEYDAAGIDFTAIPIESLLLLEDLALFKHFPYRRIESLSPHRFPNLMSLQIDTIMMPRFHVSRPFATWKKLRVLRLKCELDKAKCLEILRDASSVEDCSLHLSVVRLHGQDSTIENVVVANLKVLRLSFSFTFALWPFLDHLTFPNLHTLIIASRDSAFNFRSWDKSSLLRLAPRFGSLRSLNFNYFYLNVDIGLVLECLPLLQVLKLHCAKITTHTAVKIGRGELGGRLRELCDWSSINLLEFLQACEIRWHVTQGQSPNKSEAIARLEKISVKHSKYFKNETDCKQRIRKLCKDGVQFKCFKFPTECD